MEKNMANEMETGNTLGFFELTPPPRHEVQIITTMGIYEP